MGRGAHHRPRDKGPHKTSASKRSTQDFTARRHDIFLDARNGARATHFAKLAQRITSSENFLAESVHCRICSPSAHLGARLDLQPEQYPGVCNKTGRLKVLDERVCGHGQCYTKVGTR